MADVVTPSEITSALNEQQCAAVCHGTAPLLIVAGPGTTDTGTQKRGQVQLLAFGHQCVSCVDA